LPGSVPHLKRAEHPDTQRVWHQPSPVIPLPARTGTRAPGRFNARLHLTLPGRFYYQPTAWRRQEAGEVTSARDRSRKPRWTALGAAVLAALALAGCGKAGYGAAIAPAMLSVNSAALSQNVLPQRYTCHGTGINPPINWSGAPPGTKSFALVVDDSSAPITPFIYWIVFHIGPGTTDIQEGMLPTGARQALNSANTIPYDAPCPVGHSHMYRFTVYALNTEIDLPPGASLERVWTAIAAATIGRGRKVVTGYP
jgi:Raf kinase inhibitor-like YbhB/YbcL family protein